KKGSSFNSVFGYIWIHTAFKPERGICAQAMPFGAFTHAYRIKIGAFQKDPGSIFGHPAAKSAKDSGQGKGLFGITNHEVFLVKLSFHLIKGNEFCSCRQGL